MNYVLYHLAKDQDIQNRVRKEIAEALEEHGGQPDYDTIERLPWLNAIVKEVLRVHPPLPVMMLTASKDSVMPLSQPVELSSRQGGLVNSLFLPAGTNVNVGFGECNLRSDIWGDDARDWRPQRWLNGPPQTVKDAKIPGVSPSMHLMTFSGGPKGCIGYKYALFEISTNGLPPITAAAILTTLPSFDAELVLVMLLRAFRFSLREGVEIEWINDLMIFPKVKGVDGAQLPLFVEPIVATL